MRTKKSARLSSVGLCEDSLKFWEQRGQPGCPQQGWAWPQEDKKNLWGPRGQRARLSWAWERLKFEAEIQKHLPSPPLLRKSQYARTFVAKITTYALWRQSLWPCRIMRTGHNMCHPGVTLLCHYLMSLLSVTVLCHCIASLSSDTLSWWVVVVRCIVFFLGSFWLIFALVGCFWYFFGL